MKTKSSGGAEAPAPVTGGGWAERRFGRILAAMFVVALLLRVGILVDYVTRNPLASMPVNDANTYWDWAERVATGRLMQDQPFFSAPLYPYALGVVRAVGGGLTTVYALQMLADLATGCLLAVVCRRRFGAAVGLLAAALFWLLQEPASFSLRVLACSQHVLLVTAAWAALVWVQARPTTVRRVVAGAAAGLLCLAYAPATMLLPLIALWLFLQSPRHITDARRALIPVGVALVLIAPATWHNRRATNGELFLVQSGSGITLRQGNQPESKGVYTPIAGVSLKREEMHTDAAKLYRAAKGIEPTWQELDRYFRDQVLSFWAADVPHAMRLAATKLYWFLTSRNYGDIYMPKAELAYGLSRGLWLAPLPVAWLMGPAIVGLILLLRCPIRHAPEWLLLIAPLFVSIVFFYSPRYRIPALPILVVPAAWALVRAAQWRVNRSTAAAVSLTLVAGIVLGVVNRAVGFDTQSPANLSFTLAYAYKDRGDLAAAARTLREGLKLKPDDGVAHMLLGDVLTDLAQPDEALIEYEQASNLRPDDVGLIRKVGQLLVGRQRFVEADAALSRALQNNPNDAALLGTLAAAKQGQGQLEPARQLFERAVALAPGNVKLRAIHGALLEQMQRWDEARAQYDAIAQASPADFDAHYHLGVIWGQLGDFAKARASLARAAALNPKSVDALFAIGAIDLQQGHLADAADSFRKALAIDPNEPRCRAALKHIEELQQAGKRDGP